MLGNKNQKQESINISTSYDERANKLQILIDVFEEVALNNGPVSANELKTRIDKIIKDFDKELNALLDKKIEEFWNNNKMNNHSSLDDDKSKISNKEIPKFLRNYKK